MSSLLTYSHTKFLENEFFSFFFFSFPRSSPEMQDKKKKGQLIGDVEGEIFFLQKNRKGKVPKKATFWIIGEIVSIFGITFVFFFVNTPKKERNLSIYQKEICISLLKIFLSFFGSFGNASVESSSARVLQRRNRRRISANEYSSQ